MIDTADTLNLWHEQRRVGQLWLNPTRAARHGRRACGFAVFLSLELTAREFVPEEGTAQRGFANPLPEGAVREHIVRDLKLPNTDFDLFSQRPHQRR